MHIRSVAVVGDEGAGSITRSSLVLTLRSGAIGPGAFEESSLCSLNVLGLTLPCLQDRLLEGTSVREGQCPWSGGVLKGVHRVQIKGCRFFALSAGEEGDSWKGGHDSAGQSSNGHPCDLLWSGLVGAVGAFGNHVWLEERSLDDKVLVEHGFHDGAEDLLGDAGAGLDVVAAVGEDLWLNDWHKTVILADRAVASKGVGSLVDGELTWESGTDLEDGSPLGEPASLLVESLGSGGETVETLGGALLVGSSKNDESLIELDTGVDASLTEKSDKVLSISGLLVDGLLEHDDTANVLLDRWSGEKKLTVGASIGLGVLNTDLIETLSDGSSALVRSQDALASGRDLAGSFDEFVLEREFSFNHV